MADLMDIKVEASKKQISSEAAVLHAELMAVQIECQIEEAV